MTPLIPAHFVGGTPSPNTIVFGRGLEIKMKILFPTNKLWHKGEISPA